MLTEQLIERVLTEIPKKTVGLVGDLFLDRYLDLDDAFTEPSLETGLPAYQVTRVRSYPGALGTVMNNLVALGVGRLRPLTIIGDDGEGYELLQALKRHPSIDLDGIVILPERRTPTYTKPMLKPKDGEPRELSRLDIKNRTRLPAPVGFRMISKLNAVWNEVDALLVVDQVSEEDCGVVTAQMRDYLAQLGKDNPSKFVLADSRERIHSFRDVCVKPNERESQLGSANWNRTVFATRGERGILLSRGEEELELIPAYPVHGPTDIVGAGDSCSAGIACGMVSGLKDEEAAAFGNLIASITVQQIGTTGSATPAQVRDRWRALQGNQ